MTTRLTGVIHVLHDPIHSCFDASVIAEVNTLDARVTRKAHVNQLTNNTLVDINSWLTHTMCKSTVTQIIIH